MIDDADTPRTDRRDFAKRLWRVSGKIEAGIYARPMTPGEIRFHLEWADALANWSAWLWRSDKASRSAGENI